MKMFMEVPWEGLWEAWARATLCWPSPSSVLGRRTSLAFTSSPCPQGTVLGLGPPALLILKIPGSPEADGMCQITTPTQVWSLSHPPLPPPSACNPDYPLPSRLCL